MLDNRIEKPYTDSTDFSGEINEIYDIPIIREVKGEGHSLYKIQWGLNPKGLSPRLSEGLELNEEQYIACYEAIEEIKKKYYPEGYGGRDEWGENSNGTHYLKTLMPNPGSGVWMYVYAHKGEPRHLDARMSRLDLSNVYHSEQALFFAESLVVYLRHLGIKVPGIYSEIEETKERKMKLGDREIIYPVNILSYSFEYPYVEGSESLLTIGLKNKYGIEAEIQWNRIVVGNEVIYEKRQKDNGDFVWVGKKQTGSDAIIYFSTLVECAQFMISEKRRNSDK